MTFQIPVGRSNHWAMGDSWCARPYTRFLYVWHVSCHTARLNLSNWWVRLPLGAQKSLFLSISTWERFFIIYTLSKSPVHLSWWNTVNVIIFVNSAKAWWRKWHLFLVTTLNIWRINIWIWNLVLHVCACYYKTFWQGWVYLRSLSKWQATIFVS